uniref:Uncharacterized protein n=1 Tax=Aegilops tauschii subsp. strangulata TaxID=200361 RepID=A0A452XD23_AEGTS
LFPSPFGKNPNAEQSRPPSPPNHGPVPYPTPAKTLAGASTRCLSAGPTAAMPPQAAMIDALRRSATGGANPPPPAAAARRCPAPSASGASRGTTSPPHPTGSTSTPSSRRRDIQGEIQQMREEGHEKDRQIRSIVEDSEKERRSRHIRIKQFDHDKELMRGTLQGYKEKLKKSSDAFLEYQRMCEGSGVSSSGVMADEQNRILMMEKQSCVDNITWFRKYMLSRFGECADEIAILATRTAYLNNELQRLNDYIQIPDLNNGGPQL